MRVSYLSLKTYLIDQIFVAVAVTAVRILAFSPFELYNTKVLKQVLPDFHIKLSESPGI